MPPTRSVLYVPGDKPRAIEKARTLGADAIILDLEDAVAPEYKHAAREHVREALRTPWPVPVLIRVNGLNTPWEHDDRELALTAGAVAQGPAAWFGVSRPGGLANPPQIGDILKPRFSPPQAALPDCCCCWRCCC